MKNGEFHVNQITDYAHFACETMMRKFKPQELPPIRSFHYHQGVFLAGMMQIYEITKNEAYLRYIKEWIDLQIDATGNIKHFNPGKLDDLQPGILLFPLFEKTADPRYKIALDTIAYFIRNFPRTPEGGYWHMACCRNQMWLDGLYMAGPFGVQYGLTFNVPDMLQTAVQQVQIMKKNTCDDASGLWVHAWDYEHTQPWADQITGRSPEFWSRSMGWVVIALTYDLAILPPSSEHYNPLKAILTELLEALLPWQDADTGMWYQVTDKVADPNNWAELSATCMFAAAICKAVRLGIFNPKHLDAARRGISGVLNRLSIVDGDLQIPDICVGTGVGDYAHYLARPTSVNDLHGVGAFLMMCAEGIKCEKSCTESP
jgi:unsaturated rhamnogalacturonyl hydrolase